MDREVTTECNKKYFLELFRISAYIFIHLTEKPALLVICSYPFTYDTMLNSILLPRAIAGTEDVRITYQEPPSHIDYNIHHARKVRENPRQRLMSVL